MQQSRAHCTFDNNGRPLALPGFARWLPRHCGLVAKLVLRCSSASDVQAAQAMVELALLCSTAQPAVSRAGRSEPPGLSVASLLRDAVPLPLQLNTLNTSFLVSPAALNALARAGMQRLCLRCRGEQLTPGFAAALRGLQSLNYLALPEFDLPPLHCVVEAIGSLQPLTYLGCQGLGVKLSQVPSCLSEGGCPACLTHG